ncbi:MAG: flagellar hook-basal body complex protein FliE [Pararhizobium sp.]
MIDPIQTASAAGASRGLSLDALGGPLGGDAAADPASAAGSSFAATLSGMAKDTVDTLRNAEHVSFKAIKGEASTREVVDAVMTAQRTLQTALAIRDKIVSSYLEVSRMTI